ncbi:phytanoyl-CoA dioxygenase family protein [Spirillospora sp. NPDC047279]|uniref:phytanoyl-CoA dioxygenase family protein n=1 Tax=Spirillospora sp. NPDC047279 TaxID=3155478 RepID=UPI0034105B62
MFSHDDIAHYEAFGFVVLRGLLTAGEAARLRAEVTTELRAAFGGIGTAPGDEGGIPGDYLPLAVDRAPFAQSLIADDPRFYQGATELCGTMTVPAGPGIATCFTGNAGWHTDVGPDVRGIKFLLHLDPRTAATGALRVISGSHDPAFARRVERYLARDPANQGFLPGLPVPDTALETEPGDVLAFDAHLHHSSRGGDRRVAWSVEYLEWPGAAGEERRRTVRGLIDCDGDHDDVDTGRWPVWREWAAGAAHAGPSRRTALERLELLGVGGLS